LSKSRHQLNTTNSGEGLQAYQWHTKLTQFLKYAPSFLQTELKVFSWAHVFIELVGIHNSPSYYFCK